MIVNSKSDYEVEFSQDDIYIMRQVINILSKTIMDMELYHCDTLENDEGHYVKKNEIYNMKCFLNTLTDVSKMYEE